MKPVQFLTNAHDEEDFNRYTEKDRHRRKNITNYHEELQEAPLRIPHPINEYNKCMGYVDVHAQLESYYSVQQSHFRNWWPLFFFILDAMLVNVWIILRLSHSTIFHRDMQAELACALISEGRIDLESTPVQWPSTKRKPTEEVSRNAEHILVKSTRKHCFVCRKKKQRKARKRPSRKVMSEVDANARREPPLRANTHGSQTIYMCGLCQVPLCKVGSCWNDYHSK
jgi:hypothetical protein